MYFGCGAAGFFGVQGSGLIDPKGVSILGITFMIWGTIPHNNTQDPWGKGAVGSRKATLIHSGLSQATRPQELCFQGCYGGLSGNVEALVSTTLATLDKLIAWGPWGTADSGTF